MFNGIFGEIYFSFGWKTKAEITLWREVYEIVVDAEAYFENEEITFEQERAYETFNNSKQEKQDTIESLLLGYYNNERDESFLHEQLTPKTLVFDREGGCALLLDDEEDPDNGLAVILIPDEEVMTQDEYL